MRRIIGALAAVGAITAGVVATNSIASAGDQYASYVALGDSFSSASGVPNQVSLNCTRSDNNYPSLVAKELKPSSLTDVTCGGATTVDMTGLQLPTMNPPQFGALKPDTELVTVGIGGNDVPFAGVVMTCGSMGAFQPVGSPCKDHYTRGGTDRLAADIHKVGPKVGAVLDGIHQRSPRAKVLLVGYPALMPESGSGCWPAIPISAGDAPYLRDATKLLNTVLAQQAAAHGATYVDVYTSSIGHDLCALPGVKWVEGLLPTSPSAPIHPNLQGTQNQARQVLAALHR
ncbi:SGNH/GDSL hydrolase family protein [Saccharopolyspora taberi]|uniref:SGNH/GDSL hydrolase family protein n=1 Tax=Saccharopolyspora taberi TaxID=60895 RepID=A0ABN3VAZ0_9PSEU